MLKNTVLLNAVNTVYMDEKIWFWGKNVNGLFCLDLESNECKFLLKEAKTSITDVLRYSSCLSVNKEIYFTPFNSHNICVYDTFNCCASYYDIKTRGEMYSSFVLDSWIYFIGSKRVVRINCENKHVEELIDFSREGFYSNPCRAGDSLFSVSREKGYVNEFNMKSLSIRKHFVGELDDTFSALCYDNVCVWMAGYKAIYKWNPQTEEINRFDLPDVCVPRDSILYSEPYRAGCSFCNNIWFSPAKMNAVIRFDGRKITVVDLLREDEIGGEFLHKDKNRMCLVIDKYMKDYKVSRTYDISFDGTKKENGVFAECKANTLMKDEIVYENLVFDVNTIINSVNT